MLYSFSVCSITVFIFFFYEDLAVVRKYIYTIKIYCWWYFPRGFLYKFMTWRFSLLHFFSKVSINILISILAIVFFIVSFSRVCCLGFCSILRSLVAWLHLVCVFLTILKKGKKHLSECFLFLRHAGVGQIDAGVEISRNLLFSLPNVLADIFNGKSVWE